MKFTNHNSNCFKPTTHDIGQSLVNDFWTIANKVDLALCRWQDAADQGYGFLPWWGEATDLALEGFDWFCSNVLRNLVAIAVYSTLITIYVGQQVHCRYVASGRAQAHWEFINNVVDDGVGLHGPSPIGDAVASWGLNKAQGLAAVAVGAFEYMTNWLISGYGRLQARVLVVS